MTGDRLLRGALILTLAATWIVSGCASHTPLDGCDAADRVTPICGFENPEDLVDLGSGWLLISQMTLEGEPGSLVAFRPTDGRRQVLFPTTETTAIETTDGACAPPANDAFAPHGIDLSRDGRTLWVVNHGGREAVEQFRIDLDDGAPALTWIGCVAFDDAILLNDVASLPGGGFVVTEMVGKGLMSPLGLVLGRNTGRVWQGSPEAGARAIPGTEANGPNGIVASPDGETIYVAEWGKQQLLRFARDGSGRRSVPLGFHPDNLSWTDDGLVLAGGQITGPIEARGCFDLAEGGCRLASAVATIDPESLVVERIWTHDPATAAGGISSALRRGDRIWLGAFGGDRIAWIPAE